MKLRPKSRDGSFDYVNQYHKLDEIYAELERLSKANPKKVEVSSFGKSFQNMDLKVVKMFGGVLPKNKFVVIECGIHAREWISHAFCMWFINKMLSGSPLLNSYDFLIVPVLNPDGYVFITRLMKN